jgi:hypothetical protein
MTVLGVLCRIIMPGMSIMPSVAAMHEEVHKRTS